MWSLYQDAAMVSFPLNTSHVFSSGLNMLGVTVRDALVFTIGRALMKTNKAFWENKNSL